MEVKYVQGLLDLEFHEDRDKKKDSDKNEVDSTSCLDTVGFESYSDDEGFDCDETSMSGCVHVESYVYMSSKEV